MAAEHRRDQGEAEGYDRMQGTDQRHQPPQERRPIPTMAEVAERIEQRFAACAVRGGLDEDIADSISIMLVDGSNGDVFEVVAMARGCHAAAEAIRQAGGDPAIAEWYHSLGQLLLLLAVDTFAGILATVVAESGIVRH
jgi:hypothetical protein